MNEIITWIPRENYMALKIHTTWYHGKFFSPYCNLYYIQYYL